MPSITTVEELEAHRTQLIGLLQAEPVAGPSTSWNGKLTVADTELVDRIEAPFEAGCKLAPSTARMRRQVRKEYESLCTQLGFPAYPIDNAREALFMLELRPATSKTSYSHLGSQTVVAWRSALTFLRSVTKQFWPEQPSPVMATDGTILHALLKRPSLGGGAFDFDDALELTPQISSADAPMARTKCATGRQATTRHLVGRASVASSRWMGRSR